VNNLALLVSNLTKEWKSDLQKSSMRICMPRRTSYNLLQASLCQLLHWGWHTYFSCILFSILQTSWLKSAFSNGSEYVSPTSHLTAETDAVSEMLCSFVFLENRVMEEVQKPSNLDWIQFLYIKKGKWKNLLNGVHMLSIRVFYCHILWSMCFRPRHGGSP
jgi:hypothetical protein